MTLDELRPGTTHRVRFTLRDRLRVPHCSGCYALATFEGSLIYVGLTDNLHRRLGEHLESPKKRSVSSIGRAWWFAYVAIPPNRIHQCERGWLEQHQAAHGRWPVFNHLASPVY